MSKIIPFITKGSKKTKDGEVVDHGKLGSLDYQIFKRGCIHISDGKLLFRKGIEVFEEAVEDVDFETIDKSGHRIEGAGDTDHLVLKKNGGDIVLTLKRRDFPLISKLKDILEKGLSKTKKRGSK